MQTREQKEEILKKALEIGAMDYSMISMYDDCKQLYKYVYEDGYFNPVGEKALFSKNLVHKAMYIAMTSSGIHWAPLWDAHIVDCTKNKIMGISLSLELAKEVYSRLHSRLIAHGITEAQPEELFLSTDPPILSKPDLVFVNGRGEKVVLDYKLNFRTGVRYPMFMRQFIGQMITTGAVRVLVAKTVINARVREEPQIDVGITDQLITLDHVERVKREWGEQIKDRDARRESNKWPQNDHNCFKFNTPCHFLAVCEAGANARGYTSKLKKKDNRFDYLLD